MTSPRSLVAQKKIRTGEEVCAEILRRSPDGKIFLSFSCGKDSIGAWLALRRYQGFREIVPVYMYLFPHLSFVDEALDYYEKFFGTKIIRMPHPSLYRWIDNALFQAPTNLPILNELALPEISNDEVFQWVAEDLGWPTDTWVAVGIRALDNLVRRAAATRTQGITDSRRTFWPIIDWSNDRLFDELRRARVKLPIDYRIWGHSFDGIHYQYLAQLKRHFPADYERVKTVFPVCEVELWRMHFANQDYLDAIGLLGHENGVPKES